MATLVPSFVIESPSFLQVTRICIKPWTNLHFGLIRTLTTESAALENLKKMNNNDVATIAFIFV